MHVGFGFALGSAWWLAFGGAVAAADMTAAADAASPPAWAGLYLGAHGGYGRKDNDFYSVATTNPLTFIGGIKSRGGLIGGHVGYNWQQGSVVTGIELDFSASRIRGVTDTVGATLGAMTAAFTIADDVKYLGTARARFGFAPLPNLLVYGTAGLAWERLNQAATALVVSPPDSTSQATTRPNDWFGWVAGAGVELMLTSPSWIGRVEYLHYDFGRVVPAFSSFATGPPAQTLSDNVKKQTIDVGRIALSYKFGDGAAPASGAAIVKAPPATASGSWAGFYFGVHGGGGRKHDDFSTVVSVSPPVSIDGVRSKGALAGGQAGYNWQFGSFVAGLELDFSAARVRGISNAAFIPPPAPIVAAETLTMAEDVKYLGTARARLGLATAESLLFYASAGLAWERLDQTVTQVSSSGVFLQTQVSRQPLDWFGWAAGVGTEVMLGSPNWIGRIEYLHYDFGAVMPATVVVSTVPAQSRADRANRQTIDVGRVALSYKFNQSTAPAAGALVAKAPQPDAPPSWAGFYLGVHGGGGQQRNAFSQFFGSPPPTRFEGIISTGTVVGGQAGYNWQNGRTVTGFELDFSAAHITGASIARVGSPPTTFTGTLADDVKYLGSARARLGFAPVANLLLYGTAGLAWERVERGTTVVTAQIFVNGSFFNVSTSIRPNDWFGWVAGLGAEIMLNSPNWIGRVEYLHYDFGTVQPTSVFSTTVPAGFSANTANRQTIDMARVAVSYKIAP